MAITSGLFVDGAMDVAAGDGKPDGDCIRAWRRRTACGSISPPWDRSARGVTIGSLAEWAGDAVVCCARLCRSRTSWGSMSPP